MRQGPAEIDFDLDDPAVADGQHFGVAERLAAAALADIGRDHLLAVADQADELVAGDPCVVRPAALEIGLPIDAVVERAGEVEVLGDHRLGGGAVAVGIGLVALPDDGDRVLVHGLQPSPIRYTRYPMAEGVALFYNR